MYSVYNRTLTESRLVNKEIRDDWLYQHFQEEHEENAFDFIIEKEALTIYLHSLKVKST